MIRKYQVHNQLKGCLEDADTFEDAKKLQERLRLEYLDSLKGIFAITVMTKNSDDSWTQAIADENGNPIVFTEPTNE